MSRPPGLSTPVGQSTSNQLDGWRATPFFEGSPDSVAALDNAREAMQDKDRVIQQLIAAWTEKEAAIRDILQPDQLKAFDQVRATLTRGHISSVASRTDQLC